MEAKKIAQSFQSNFEQKEFRYQNTLFQDIYKSVITKTEWNCHKRTVGDTRDPRNVFTQL